MKINGWLLSLCLAALCAVPSDAQQALVPAGSSNLTPGQYMMTNLNTGQALYIVIDQSGRVYAQDPRVLQFVVQTGQGQTGIGQVGIGQPGIGQGQLGYPQQQGGLGGLLKQGLQDMVKNKLTPQPAVGAPAN